MRIYQKNVIIAQYVINKELIQENFVGIYFEDFLNGQEETRTLTPFGTRS